MDAVVAGKRRQAHVGDDEPLRRQGTVIIAAGALGRRCHHVDARLQVTQRLVDRECGNDVLIERGGGGEFAGPDLYAALVAEIGQLVAGERFLKIAVDHGADQIAIADPEHVDVHRRGIDADQGDAALAGARQHIGPPREAHERLAVADIDVELGRFRQAFLDGRRQAGAQIEIVPLAMFQAVDAELLALGRQRRLVGAGEREERREIDPLGEVFGELETSPRRRPVGINRVIQQPETVLVAHFLVLAADLGDLAHVERQPQAIQRRPPQLSFGHRPAQHSQRVSFLSGVAGALIGDIGGGRGPLQKEGLLARTGRTDLEHCLGQPQPVGAVLGRGGGDLADDLQAGPEVETPEGGIRIGSQRRGRLGNRACLALDLGLQLHGGISEIIAFEGLVRGQRRHQAKRHRGANDNGANQTDHDGTPCADFSPHKLKKGAKR